MELTKTQAIELKGAVDQLGNGQFTFKPDAVYKIARHSRILRGVAEDVAKVHTELTKKLLESESSNAAAQAPLLPSTPNVPVAVADSPLKIQLNQEFQDFLASKVEVDISPDLSMSDLRLWDSSNKEGNKISPNLLAQLQPILLSNAS